MTADEVTAAARPLQENEPALRDQPLAAQVKAHIVTLFDLLAGPGVLTGTDGPAASLRVRLAISALHIAGEEAESGGQELMDAALDIACDLLDPPRPGPASQGRADGAGHLGGPLAEVATGNNP